MARLPLAAVLGLALASCVASQQTPTLAPTRALPPPAASGEVDGAFDFALHFVSQAAYGAPGARSSLAPQYREQVGDLRQALGIRRVPDSYGAGRVIDLGRPPVPAEAPDIPAPR